MIGLGSNSGAGLSSTKPRAHITLNPYSTQLVDSINMMMPGSGSSHPSSNSTSNSNSSASTGSTSGSNAGGLGLSPQLMTLTNTLRRQGTLGNNNNPNFGQPGGDDVVYRAVSPHGHVYWEIDPAQVYGTAPNQNHATSNNNHVEESVALLASHHQQQLQQQQQQQNQLISRPYLTSRAGQLTEEDLLLQQHLLAADSTNGLHDSLTGLQHPNTDSFHHQIITSTAAPSPQVATGSFVRTGASRYNRKPAVSTVSAVASADNTGSRSNENQNVPETLQTQVQIRDVKPIQVSVKSAEYIQARIKTLQKKKSGD